MHSAECPFCFSTDLKIIDTYDERRDAVIVECQRCGRRSSWDTENQNSPAVASVQPD